MKLSKLMSHTFGFVFLLLGSTFAKMADDYLHAASAKYIGGRMQEAGIEVEEGLRQYPNDAKLKNLNGLLKQMKDQQNKDQQKNDPQNQDQKDKQDKENKDKNQNGQGEQKPKDQKDSAQDKKSKEDKKQDAKPEDKKPQPNPSDSAQNKDPKDSAKGENGKAPLPGEMSKEDAERLLNSYQDDEKKEHRNMQNKQRKRVQVEKDW